MIIFYNEQEEVNFVDRYDTLSIQSEFSPGYSTNYLFSMRINNQEVKCVPLLYLDEHINEVFLEYMNRDAIGSYFGNVITIYNHISFKNYLPQVIRTHNIHFSLPRACYYKGAKIEGNIVYPDPLLAVSFDLYEQGFSVWRNGVSYYIFPDSSNGRFEVYDAYFSGELLPTKTIDDYVELKPKGD